METMFDRWVWDAANGLDRLHHDFDTHGFSLFVDPSALAKCADPFAFGEELFGERPIRCYRKVITPNPLGNQIAYPETMVHTDLHNDCYHWGMPGQMQVMVCERQAMHGGESLLMDMWPVLAKIEEQDPALLYELFNTPHILRAHPAIFQLKWSNCRGNLFFLHMKNAITGRVELAFQRYIDAGRLLTLKCHAGEVMVVNNHRMMHGRTAFTDPTRRFVRLIFWFSKPLKSPQRYLDMSLAGTASVAKKIEKKPEWVRQLLLGDASAASQPQNLQKPPMWPTEGPDWPSKQEVLAQCISIFGPAA